MGRCLLGPSAMVWLLLWSCQLATRGVEGVGMTKPLRFVDILNNNPWEHAADSDSDASSTSSVVSKNKIGVNDVDDEDGSSNMNNNDDDDDDDDDVKEFFLMQRLDHFAPSQDHVLMQRYFYSSRFVDPSSNNNTNNSQQYAFLCVGGEGPAMRKSVLVDSVHCTGDMLELAAKLHKEQGANVHLFGLEHRYYGRSYPTFKDANGESVSPVTNENLVYLSSRQALADLAHFVSKMTTDNNKGIRGGSWASQSSPSGLEGMVPSTCRWVTFGGSYPGMVAGWARLKYPHLIHAAVSNSAPIQAKADMASYNNRVAFDLQYELIGGSEACLDIFEEGHAQLVDALETGGSSARQTIANQFNLCDSSDLLDQDNARQFLGEGVVELGIQSNDPSCQEEMCNVEKMCSFALERRQANTTKASWEILADIAHEQGGDDDCMTLNWNSTLDYIADPHRGMMGGLRSWIWQTCTEFGFYQTCNVGSNCPYGRGYHPLEQDLTLCSYAFGINNEEVKESIRQTLEYYGDKELKGGSRILSVNGNVDPWSTLARTNSTTAATESATTSHDILLPIYNVVGASHHFWTHPPKSTDDPKIGAARDFIHQTVTDWLMMDSGRIVSSESSPTVETERARI